MRKGKGAIAFWAGPNLVVWARFASHFLDSPPHAEEIDLQFSLEDLETIGKGSDGVVQLVRQKWIGTLFASKVLLQIT
ncbi:hypothetical protein Tco_1224013 [Tanacetum coccineum]